MKKSLPIFLLCVCFSWATYGGVFDSSQHLSLSLPYLNGGDILQDIFLFSNKSVKKAELHLSLYKYGATDSQLIYSIDRTLTLKDGANIISHRIFKEGKLIQYDQVFFEIIKNYGVCPVGAYRYSLSIRTQDTILLGGTFSLVVDSTLSKFSGLQKVLDEYLLTDGNISDYLLNGSMNQGKLDRLNDKLQVGLGRKRGLSIAPNYKRGTASVFIYYKGWFLGRYTILSKQQLTDRIQREKQQMLSSATSLFNGNLMDQPSVLSQFKQLDRVKEQQKDKLVGNLSVGTHWGNGQDPGSTQDNNYQEYAGTINTKVLGVPVVIDGYYTSQDEHRAAKASFIRVHYDVDAAKNDLSSKIDAYRRMYDQTLNSKGSVVSIYQNYINKLEQEQKNLAQQLSNEYGVSANDGMDTEALMRGIADTIGSSSDSGNVKHTIEQKSKLLDIYTRYQTLSKELAKYKDLFNQYNESLFMDSVLVYDKVKKYNDGDFEDVSYKDMVKSASNMLPEGKAKTLFNGVTAFDIGIINQYQSKYTMSGQTVKGGSLGYDLGFATTTVVLGKTEYISRTGGVDRYNSALIGIDITKLKKHAIGFKYYVYTPTKQIYKSEYFQYDVASPTFKSPVQIPSLNYQGSINKDITVSAEGAASFRKGVSDRSLSKDNAALTTTVDYNIRRAGAVVKGTYEHVGAQFNNSSLPYIRSATERYELEAKKSLFKNFLKVSVQFNYFKQTNFSSIGYSKKWGFDLITRSKQYPNVRLSYKPFSTFRAFNDTFSIEQRPLVGAVWLANGSYQIKRQHAIHRFMLLYNNSTSEQDSINYSSSTCQMSYMLNKGKLYYNLNIGWYQLPSSYDQTWDKESYFVSNALSFDLLKRLSASVNQHLSISGDRIQRVAFGMGCVYRFDKLPIMLRSNIRYTHLSADKTYDQQNLWYTDMVLSWYFKIKNK